MRARLVGFLLFLAVAAYRATLRIRITGEANRKAIEAAGKPVLHALWHQRMVGGILAHPFSGTVTMASLSNDGEVIARFLGFWGFRAVRGSSSRGGGPALAAMVQALRSGTRWAALTPDGPRGPARRCKTGLARLAATLEAPVLPVGTSSTRPRFLRSWDRFLVPLPFSRCAVVFDPPVARLPGETDEGFLERVDAAIERATGEADRLCAVVNAPRERAPNSASGGAEEAG